MSNEALLDFDERVYSVEAVQKAAYRLMNSIVVDISIKNGKILCKVNPSIGIDPVGLEKSLQEFKKEVLDQHLRLKIKSETEQVRNLIIGIAFSNTGLQSSE